MLPAVMSSVLTIHNVMPQVMSKVAALTQVFQVVEPVVVLVSIHVSGCKNNDASGFWVWPPVLCSTIRVFWRPLASVT